MTPRARLFIFIALAASIVALGAVAARHTGDPAGAAAAQPRFSGGFSLSTTDGRAVTDRDYRGKWLIVYFGYTFCPDACPTALSAIALSLQRLGPLADKIQPLFITLDPARDTPAVLADYVKAFDARIQPLLGTPDQTASAAKAYRVSYLVHDLGDGSYSVDHSSFIYIVDPQGKFVRLLTGDVPGHQLAEELQEVLN